MSRIRPDPNPALFVSDLKDANQKYFFLSMFFSLLLLEGTLTSFFNDKKSWRNHKTEDKVFLKFLLDDGRIWIRTSD